MPILYPIAFLYNLVTYWMDKYLMLNFYRKSITFNEYVPMQTLSLFKYPLIMHGIVAVYMMSNMQIFYSEAAQDSGEARAVSFNSDISYYAQQFRTNLDQRLNLSHITLLLFFYTVLAICYLARESISRFFAICCKSEEVEIDDQYDMDAKTRAKVERYQMNKKFRERQMRKLGKIKKKEIKRESDSSDSDDNKNTVLSSGTFIDSVSTSVL